MYEAEFNEKLIKSHIETGPINIQNIYETNISIYDFLYISENKHTLSTAKDAGPEKRTLKDFGLQCLQRNF